MWEVIFIIVSKIIDILGRCGNSCALAEPRDANQALCLAQMEKGKVRWGSLPKLHLSWNLGSALTKLDSFGQFA